MTVVSKRSSVYGRCRVAVSSLPRELHLREVGCSGCAVSVYGVVTVPPDPSVDQYRKEGKKSTLVCIWYVRLPKCLTLKEDCELRDSESTRGR